MLSYITVEEFIEETKDDYNSPTTSTFVSRMPHCRNTISALEETLDADREALIKFKKAIKAAHTSGITHVDNEVQLSSALEKLGNAALQKDQEADIAAAFIKFSIVTKELSALMKTLMQNINNIVMYPLDSLLKGDLRGMKGDLKRPFDKAWKDYESKYVKIEKEKKQQAKEAGLIRTEVTSAEIADEMEKERRMFQLQMCEYLLKINEIKTRKGVDLLQNLVELYHAQTNYFQDGLKTIEHFGNYVADLSVKLQKIRQKQSEEHKRLAELRTIIRNGFDKECGSGVSDRATVYSLHQLQGDKHHGITRTGYLLKKSEGKMRRVWQKRKCSVQAEGFLDIFHADETKPPTRINLLTCQMKVVHDDRRCFDLVSYNRTYHFQAEDESDAHAWMSVLVNCKELALMKAFDDNSKAGAKDKMNSGFNELKQAIIHFIQRQPGNDQCADCNSYNDATWLSTNFGIIVCIECSGIHRDLGVHISRIQSLTLDNVGTSQLLLARFMTNQTFNEIMEAKLNFSNKPTPNSTMDERYDFIRAKYVDKKYVMKSCNNQSELLNSLEYAITHKSLEHLLQVFGENADLNSPLPSSDCGETSLHVAVQQENGNSLHIVDFVVQNISVQGLNRQTNPSSSPDRSGLNTALHLCALLNQVECMKLLLRSGADFTIRNSQDKTPLDIAQEMGHHACQELLESAVQRHKNTFDNINIDWNISHDDGSTDFSDDETIVMDEQQRNGSLTPERKCTKSRPPSYTGAGGGGASTATSTSTGSESPVTLRSRSSTYESLQSSSSSPNRQVAPPTSLHSRKPTGTVNMNIHGSLRKRVAPAPPPCITGLGVGSGLGVYSTLPSSHNRSTSDPMNAGSSYHTLGHKRSPSGDHSNRALAGAKLVLPPMTSDKNPALKRPLNPPPPAPNLSKRYEDGSPVPPPRKQVNESPDRTAAGSTTMTSSGGSLGGGHLHGLGSTQPLRRCQALYECRADNEDELSFEEGEVIVVLNEETDDDNWMEGMVEHDPSRRGMFPVSFVTMLHD